MNTTSTSATDRMRPFVVGLFFAWGFATVLVDTLIPRLKALFTLSYTEVMLTQFSFFLAYFIVSVPAGLLIARIGYVKGIVVGLITMTIGCLLFIPASSSAIYAGFLIALFVMAGGITILQVAANPLIAILGSTETSHRRLTLAQAFNSLGTTVGPLVGASLILGAAAMNAPAATDAASAAANHAAQAETLKLPFMYIAAGIAVLAAIFTLFWKVQIATAKADGIDGSTFALLTHKRVGFGALSIFLYVGAEVSIGSLLINYLMDKHTLGLEAVTAGQMIAYYWGGAMVGRFLIGSLVMNRVPAGLVLAVCAFGAAALATLSSFSAGTIAAYSAIAIGLCNSIMFPTIFTLGIENLGERTPQGSALMCLAIVGGAIVPLISGYIADGYGIATALLVPAVCYLWIATYGLLCKSGAVDKSVDR